MSFKSCLQASLRIFPSLRAYVGGNLGFFLSHGAYMEEEGGGSSELESQNIFLYN